MEGAIRVAREKCYKLIGETDQLLSPSTIRVRKDTKPDVEVVVDLKV